MQYGKLFSPKTVCVSLRFIHNIFIVFLKVIQIRREHTVLSIPNQLVSVIFKWFSKCFFQLNLMSLLTSFNGFRFDVHPFCIWKWIFLLFWRHIIDRPTKRKPTGNRFLCCVSVVFLCQFFSFHFQSNAICNKYSHYGPNGLRQQQQFSWI